MSCENDFFPFKEEMSSSDRFSNCCFLSSATFADSMKQMCCVKTSKSTLFLWTPVVTALDLSKSSIFVRYVTFVECLVKDHLL